MGSGKGLGRGASGKMYLLWTWVGTTGAVWVYIAEVEDEGG